MFNTTKYTDQRISDIISSSIRLSVVGKSKSKFGKNSKQRDFNFYVTDFNNRLQRLELSVTNLRQRIAEIDRLFILATKKKQMKPLKTQKLLQYLEEHFKLMETAQANYENARKILKQIQTSVGDSRAAKNLVESAKVWVKETDDDLSTVKRKLSGIASTQRPRFLEEKGNPEIDRLFRKISKHIKLAGQRCKDQNLGFAPSWGGKFYFYIDKIASGKRKGGLRFTRYDEIKDVPKEDGSKLSTLYIAVTVDLNFPKLLYRRFTGKFSDMYLSVTTSKVRPNALEDNFLVKNPKTVDKILDYFSSELGIAIFYDGVVFRGDSDVNKVLKERSKEFKWLTHKDIMVETEGRDIIVTVPRELAVTGDKKPVMSETEKALERLSKTGVTEDNILRQIYEKFPTTEVDLSQETLDAFDDYAEKQRDDIITRKQELEFKRKAYERIKQETEDIEKRAKMGRKLMDIELKKKKMVEIEDMIDAIQEKIDKAHEEKKKFSKEPDEDFFKELWVEVGKASGMPVHRRRVTSGMMKHKIEVGDDEMVFTFTKLQTSPKYGLQKID
jgi:hypothetical protein